MSNLPVRRIEKKLDEHFDGLIDLSDVASHPAEQRRKMFLTRAQAAYIVMMMRGVEPSEAAKSVVDGTKDNGLDAIHVDRDLRKVLLVQSKWVESGKGSVATADMDKFVRGFKDFYSYHLDRFNSKIQALKDDIVWALDDGNVSFELVVVHTGSSELSEDARTIIDTELQEFNDPIALGTFAYQNLEDLYNNLMAAEQGTAVELTFDLKQWGVTTEPFTSYYGQVDATEVADWWSTHGPLLFSRNIRQVIGRSDVNDKIAETLRSEPDKFWYFNNGLTILARSITKTARGGGKRDVGSFTLEGASIVNGAQTVGAIGHTRQTHPDEVDLARVSVRVISLENCPPDFDREVTRATNTQNRIDRRDFVALDPVQERLRGEFSLEGLTYSLKTGEDVPPPSEGCTVEEATVALACSHSDHRLAVLAKGTVGRLWDDLGRPPYRTLFNPSTTVDEVWRAVQVLRTVDVSLKQATSLLDHRPRQVAVHGNRFIAHLVFRQIGRSVLSDETWDSETLKEVSGKTDAILETVIYTVERNYPNSYLASLFKNQDKCGALRKALPAKSPVEYLAPRLFRI